jgi:hypothetical protein
MENGKNRIFDGLNGGQDISIRDFHAPQVKF